MIFLLDSASELSWETPEENNEFLSPMPEEEEEDEEDDEAIKKLVSNQKVAENISRMAPLSTLSEVTLSNESEHLVRIIQKLFVEIILVKVYALHVLFRIH